MPTAILTSKGQVTIPKEVRDFLNLKKGEELDFEIRDKREVILHARNRDVRSLKGIVKSPYARPVTIQQMNEAIAKGAARGLRR
jgi:AbrB family looped-hinge helix DNA binding protein